MKTLEQWQKELPDYDVWQGSTKSSHNEGVEVLKSGKWEPIKASENGYVMPYQTGYILCIHLEGLGCIFRRKKERQREFKVTADDSAYLGYFIEGKNQTLQEFMRNERVYVATLTVNEWGGE